MVPTRTTKTGHASDPDPAKPANCVTTGSVAGLAARNRNPNPENLPPKRKSPCEDSKTGHRGVTGFGVELTDAEGAPWAVNKILNRGAK